MARVRAISGTRVVHLAEGWQFASSPPGAIEKPSALDAAGLEWLPTKLPTTAAAALRALGRFSLDDRRDFDASDWWFRCRFSRPASLREGHGEAVLRFDGLATIAQAWLDGASLLTCENMFREHEVVVAPGGGDTAELVLVFRSLKEALKVRRPRPRWKTRLVEAQQLRWHRTTLVGRIPGWTPMAAPVGPFRDICLEERGLVAVRWANVRPTTPGDAGEVRITMLLNEVGPERIREAVLRIGDARATCAIRREPGGVEVDGVLRLERVARWWPHTHGAPSRFPVYVDLLVGGEQVRIDFGSVGFRTVEIDRPESSLALRINGERVFCRGACWTPLDVIGLGAAPGELRETLRRVVEGGMNMVRVAGPFLYEDDAFYDACDELGVLVWQDYPFANMDYPWDDAAFRAQVEAEAAAFLSRTELACSIAVLCGNSEVEQQAAMMGAPRAIWRSPLFEEALARISAERRPDVPYWPSTPSGGALPFSTDSGTTHYYGVGAYLRPLEDARRATVSFATECLAFANVPSEREVDAFVEATGAAPLGPLWKRRTPRDSGAGWDFEDVRDHYLRALFGVEPTSLRYADVARYLALSRIVTGEIMAAALGEWRSVRSCTSGALVWFLRDLWPGAGWGILAASGEPKPAYYFIKRALTPLGLALLDEGLNGLDAHVLNEGDSAAAVTLKIVLLQGGEAVVRSADVAVDVGPRGAVAVRLSSVLGEFFDMTYAYRFGPPAHDAAVVTLFDAAGGSVLAQCFHFPGGLSPRTDPGLGVNAVAQRTSDDGAWALDVSTRRIALAVAIDAPGFDPSDNYFHLAPGFPRRVSLRFEGARSPAPIVSGTVHPLNAAAPTKIVLAAQATS